MLPSPTSVELRPESRQVLKAFLESREGENFLQALNALCPPILKKGTAENQIAAANSHAGYEKCLENILFFIEPEPEPAKESGSSNYPSLDNDREWPTEPPAPTL